MPALTLDSVWWSAMAAHDGGGRAPSRMIAADISRLEPGSARRAPRFLRVLTETGLGLPRSSDGSLLVGVSVALSGAMVVTLPAAPVVGDGGFEGVVDGDNAEDAVVVVEDGQAEEVVVGHHVGDVDEVIAWVGVHRVRVGHCAEDSVRISLNGSHQAEGSDQSPFSVDAVDRGECFGLLVGGLADDLQRLSDGVVVVDSEVLDPHQASGATVLVTHQTQHIRPDELRERIDHGPSAILGKVEDRIDSVIGSHPAENLGYLLSGARFQHLSLMVFFEFLEDIRFKLRVVLQVAEEIVTFFGGRGFDEVSDLRWFQSAESPETGPDMDGRLVADEGFE